MSHGKESFAASEEMHTTLPPPARAMIGVACRMTRKTAKHRRWAYARALRAAGLEHVARRLRTGRYEPVLVPSGLDRETMTAVIDVMMSLELPWPDALLPPTDEWWAYYESPDRQPLKAVEF